MTIDRLLLEDGTSRLLQEDGTSLILLESSNVTHDSSGALVGSGAVVAGSATLTGVKPILISTTLWQQDLLGTSGTPGAKSITVPSDAAAVVVQVASTMATTSPSLSITSDFAGTFTVINSNDQDGCSIGYAEVTSTGSKNLTLAWTEGLIEGPSVYISFLKNIGSSGNWVRATLAESTGAGTGNIVTSISSGGNDLILVVDEQDGASGTPATMSGCTSLATTDGTYGSASRLQSVNNPNGSSTSLTGVGTQYATLTAVAIKPVTSGPTTHVATGAIVGSGSTVAGSANRTRVHPSTGALVGSGSTVTGSASRSAGAVTHDATGALVGQGSVVAGIAARWRAFSSSGTLVGAGAVVTGAAARTRVHTSTGALVGSGSTIAGTAGHNVPHTSTGALIGSGSTLTGAASRNTTAVSHDATGTLVGQGSVLSGAAARTRQHAATGTLVGQGSTVTGSALHNVPHAATGALVGQGATISGSAARTRVHAATGALVGSGSTVAGSAYRATPGVPVWPLPSQVLAGVVYGPTGIEYVGTLVAGNSGIQYDIVTGQLVMPLANPILMTL